MPDLSSHRAANVDGEFIAALAARVDMLHRELTTAVGSTATALDRLVQICATQNETMRVQRATLDALQEQIVLLTARLDEYDPADYRAEG